MKNTICASIILAALAVPALAAEHCIEDAKLRGNRLLTLHFNDGDGSDVPLMIDDVVEMKSPVKALVGKGKFDVLEVTGYINKATYRMRFIYAQLDDTCLLMGQEIIEVANPY